MNTLRLTTSIVLACLPVLTTFADEPSAAAIPPHRALELSGLHAYAQKSIAAGETLRFRVSSTVPYDLEVLELGVPGSPETDRRLHSFPAQALGAQPIHPGSYAEIRTGLAGQPLTTLSLECWLRPWRMQGKPQGIMTQQSLPAHEGFALAMDANGHVVFHLAGASSLGPRLTERQWHHLVATWDGETMALWVDGAEVAGRPFAGPVVPPAVPLRLGASARDGVAADFLDADLAYPMIAEGVLDRQTIAARRQLVLEGKTPPLPAGAQGFWPLTEERGVAIADASGSGRHGRLINRATWMVGGPAFRADGVARFEDYDPRRDGLRGHALRFASDDLYDCRWKETCSWTLSGEARPGLYVGRFRYTLDGEPRVYDVTFVVRRAPQTKAAPILVLCSSNTWLAYNATPFANRSGMERAFWGTNGFDEEQPEAPSYSFYRNHRAGQPTYSQGLRMPWPVAGPDVHYSPPEIGYSHLVRAERFLHQWFRSEGYSFDVVSDLDLHQMPDLLDQYQVVILNGHSEYWSDAAYYGVERFLARGGNVAVFSGNTMFWRVSFDPDGNVMECRKYDSSVGGSKNTAPGELYHSEDGRRGGLSRESGVPAWKLLGLECSGWWGVGRENNFGVYTVRQADHFLFRHPELVPVENGETLGHAPDGGLPRIGGHEADVRVSLLKSMTPAEGSGRLVPDDPAGIVSLAQMAGGERGLLDYHGRWGKNARVVAEMIYWERPTGGRVFHAGAIASGWALTADSRLQKLVRNVLHHFGVKRPRGR
jgi:N,N-dimethylformamidase